MDVMEVNQWQQCANRVAANWASAVVSVWHAHDIFEFADEKNQ